MEDQPSGRPDESEVYRDTKASKFRLKSESRSKTSRRHRHEEEKDKGEGRSSKRHRSDESHESRRAHRDSKRRHKHRNTVYDRTFSRNGEYQDPDHRHRESLYDGLNSEGEATPETNHVDPDEAFRESLFDALADDEGAAYWEGVYGQPIHVYSNTKAGPDGILERMSDEEYAEYVRSRMWEKSHEHIVEERKAREEARKKQKKQSRGLEEETARMEQEREKVRRQMLESLKRGEERKKAKEANVAWATYTKKWDELKTNTALAQDADTNVREIIPWPVVSARWKHVSKEEIEYFLENSSAWKDDPVAMLKVERVRWHPDKMQQRFGQHIDPETMKTVTAVFQVVDRLWGERRT